MGLRDSPPLTDLAAELLRGLGPSNPEEALSILGLLAGALAPGNAKASGLAPPPARAGRGREAAPDHRQLLLAEARYRALIEQIPAVVFLASMEGGASDIYVSPQIEALLGFTQREWSGNPVLWFRQLHPEDRPRLSREFATACVTGRPFRGIVRVYSRDGRLVWVHAEARLVRDDSGRPLFLHGIAFDITEQQQAEQTRQELQLEQGARIEADHDRARLREMFSNLPAAIAVLGGPAHTIEFLNPVALDLAAAPDVIGKSWPEAFPGFPEEARAIFDRVFSTGEPFIARELRAGSPGGGDERYFNFVCQPLRDRQHAVTSLLVHAVEVSEQRKAQAAAEAASRRASFLANVSQALSASLDYESTLDRLARLVVPDVADLSSVSVVQPDGVLKMVAVVHADPEVVEGLRRLAERYPVALDAARGIGRVARTGQAEMLSDVSDAVLIESARDPEHLRLLRRLGLKSFIIVPIRGRGRVHATLRLATAESGRRYGPADLVTAEDIAQRAAIAIDNARLYREAQDASRLKDEFLATLSHELRTPLNAIVGWAHILRDTGIDASPHKTKAVETIVRNAQVQSQLISDILDVSRIVAGKLVLSVRPVDLTTVIEAALDTVRPAAQAKDIALQPIFDASAGPVSGDPSRLQQIVWNLLANAIKFTPRGGRVQARLEAINSHIEVTVEDNGPGIDPAFLPFIFERFRQADSSSTRRHGGLGLGLAIVRHMVELHGGTVEATNRQDRSGAVFKVRLPRRSVTAEPARPAERHPGAEGTVWLDSAPSLEGLHVLVVDDEPDARELIATVITRCGGEATIAGSAAAAYEALRQDRFDVIVADIEMPDEDGYEFIRSVRSLPAEQGALVPAVALTAYASTQDRVKALGAGFQIHVPKPVQPAELAAVVASLGKPATRRR